MRRAGVGPVALILAAGCAAACAPALRPPPPPETEPADAASLAAEAHTLVHRAGQEPSAARRAALATEAVAAGQRCTTAAPDAAECDYVLGLALGLQARERPSTFRKGLAEMALRLRRAAKAEPSLDRGGPHRVLALLLLRAPNWPLGPGDPEEALVEARRAVALFPEYAPNQLALAEVLRDGGDVEAGRAAARKALELAQAAAGAGEADAAGWVAEARKLGAAP